MKRIELIIGPHKLSEVCGALKTIGINDVTVSRVRDDSHREMRNEVCSGSEFRDDAFVETKLEILVSAERATEVIRTFAGSAWRSLIGDGKMFIYQVAEPVIPSYAPESRENAR